MTPNDPLTDLTDLGDRLAQLTGEISTHANRMKLGMVPLPSTTASAQIVNGSTAVGLIGIFAVVVAVAAVLVVAAWRSADTRVFEAQARMQAERNEAMEDRVGILEAQVRRLNRELEEAK